MKLVKLDPGAAQRLDSEFQRQQTARTETPLVKELADAWPSSIRKVVAPLCPPGSRPAAGSVVVHSTPQVEFNARSGQPMRCELADLLVVTGYLRCGLFQRGRAVLYQAKTPKTDTPPTQEELFRAWPPFEIVSPAIPGVDWDVGPEGTDVSPSRRGSAFLRVEPGESPERYEVDSKARTKRLGECVRSMLRLRYSRAFTKVDPVVSGRNSWDQLVTYLLQRSRSPDLQAWFGPPVFSHSPRQGDGGPLHIVYSFVLSDDARNDERPQEG